MSRQALSALTLVRQLLQRNIGGKSHTAIQSSQSVPRHTQAKSLIAAQSIWMLLRNAGGESLIAT